jgi:hypothetical protein
LGAAASKRLCLIGDSHLAAVSIGWNTLAAAEYPNVEAVFLASPGKSMRHIKVQDGALVPGTEELARHFERTAHVPAIDASYDLYAVYGLEVSVQICPGLWQAFRDAKRAREIDTAVDAGLIAATIAGQVLPRVREITDRPLVLMATPMPAEIRSVDKWAEARRNGDDARMAAFFTRSCRAFAESAGAEFMPQPEETLTSPLHTRDEYAAEQARFSKRVEALGGDGIHMSAAYGAAVMRALLRAYGVEPAHARQQGVDSSGAMA